MPTYISKIKGPTRAEFDLWVSMGYLGTWDHYCATKAPTVGQRMFITGDLGPHCADCADLGEFLCDYPVGNGKTCDRSICGEHAHEIGPDLHYCDAHYAMWTEFKNSGGVDAALRNVVAFKSEK